MGHLACHPGLPLAKSRLPRCRGGEKAWVDAVTVGAVWEWPRSRLPGLLPGGRGGVSRAGVGNHRKEHGASSLLSLLVSLGLSMYGSFCVDVRVVVPCRGPAFPGLISTPALLTKGIVVLLLAIVGLILVVGHSSLQQPLLPASRVSVCVIYIAPSTRFSCPIGRQK